MKILKYSEKVLGNKQVFLNVFHLEERTEMLMEMLESGEGGCSEIL